MQQKRKCDLITIGFMAAVVMFLIHIICFSQYDYSSDQSLAVFLADEIMKNGFGSVGSYISQQSIVPVNFLHYWGNLLARLFTDNLMVVLKFGFIGNMAMLIGAILYSSKYIFREEGASTYKIASILILSGLGSTLFRAFEMYDPFYTIITAASLVMFVLLYKNIEAFKLNRTILIVVIMAYFVCVDIRMGSSFCLPFLMAYTLYNIMEHWESEKPVVLLHIKKYSKIIIGICIACVIGLYIRYYLINNIIYINSRWASSSALQFTKFDDIAINVLTLFLNTITLFGYANGQTYPIISLYGMVWFLSALITLVVMFIIPYKMFKERDKLPKTVVLFLFLYICSFAFNFIVFSLSTNMDLYREADVVNGSHYYLIAQVQAIMLTSYYLVKYIRERKKFLSRLIIVGVGVVYVIQSYAIGAYVANGYSDVSKAKKEMINAIQAKGYDYGYATFWNGPANTVLSEGKVRFNGISLINNMIKPFYDYTFRYWYSPDYYDGKTFLLLTSDEAESFDFEKAGLQYSDYESISGYNIYYFDYNIASKFYEISLLDGNSDNLMDNLYLYDAAKNENSIQLPYGAYVDLTAEYLAMGTYNFEIEIEYPASEYNSISFVQESYINDEVLTNQFELKEGINQIQIKIDRPVGTYRFYVYNDKNPTGVVNINDCSVEYVAS